MPRNALSNPITLAALGALLEQPMHAYQLAATLAERGVPVNRGSLYNTLEAMAKTGWVKASRQEQVGARPMRTVYVITATGRVELIERLDVQLRTPHREFPEFMNAVAHVGVLGEKRALDVLTQRIERLDILLAEDRQKLAEAIDGGVPRLFVIEAEYMITLLQAERNWTSQIVVDIKNGTLSWTDAKKCHVKQGGQCNET